MSNEENTLGREWTVLFKLKLFVLTAAAVVILFSCYFWAQKTIVVEVDGEQRTVKTFSATVGGVLERKKIPIFEKDEVSPGLDVRIQEGMTIRINRAAELTIAVDGNEMLVRTMARQVAEVLTEYGVELSPQDEVEPALESPASPGITIRVARISTESISVEVPVDYNVERTYTVDLPAGVNRVAQEGKEGKERQSWQITLRDGKEVLRQLIATEILEAPVDKILVCGSAAVVSRGGENIRYSSSHDMLATAYTYTGNNTASGVAPYYGVAAVDTNNISFGTRLYVDGYGYATALDRGSAIKGNRIDLFFGSYEEAKNWGVRWVKVYVIE